MKKYFSILITTEQMHQHLNNKQIIYLHGDCGSGKTTFIVHDLCRVAYERGQIVIILSNRINIVRQTFKQLVKEYEKLQDLCYRTDNYYHVTMTYQAFKDKIKDIDFVQMINNTDIIFVLDECHYFVAESWQKDNKPLLSFILNQNKTIYFASATGDETIKYIKRYYHRTIAQEYIIKRDYSYIILHEYSDSTTPERLILNALEHGTKVVYCINNKCRIDYLCTKFNDVNVKAAYSGTAEYISTNGEVKQMQCSNERDTIIDADTYKLNCNCVIGTVCISTGINIIDSSLQTIIIDIDDLENIIQTIGRRRNADTELHIYLRKRTAVEYGGLIRKNQKLLETEHDSLKRENIKNKISFYKECCKYGIVSAVASHLTGTGIRTEKPTPEQRLMTFLKEHKEKEITKDTLCLLIADAERITRTIGTHKIKQILVKYGYVLESKQVDTGKKGKIRKYIIHKT